MPEVLVKVPFVRGKGRVRFVRATGRRYTPDKTAEAMELIRMAYVKEAHGLMAPKGVPVRVAIVTTRPMPKSRPKRITKEPDVDNIAKLVLDALNGVAWVDDTQVVAIAVQKLPRDRVTKEQTTIALRWQEEQE